MKKVSLTAVFSIFLVVSYAQEKQGITTLKTESKLIYDICFSPKGNLLIVPDQITVKVFAASGSSLVREFKGGHRGEILTVDLSRDSLILASGGKDSTIVLWDFITGEKLRTLHQHRGIVTCVKISADSRFLASGGSDHKVVLYNLVTGNVVAEFDNNNEDITSVCFSPNCNILTAGGGDKDISVYSCIDPHQIGSLHGHKNWVRDMTFSHDGKRLVSCGDDGNIIKWDFSDPANVNILSSRRDGLNWILTIDNSIDDEIFAIGDNLGTVKVLWPKGIYSCNLKSPVNKVLLRPLQGNEIEVAVATRGKGVMIINGSGFKLETKVKYNFFPYKS
jgi:WD40 repeat protein